MSHFPQAQYPISKLFCKVRNAPNDELVTVLTLNDPIKAELVKVVLQDHDLFCAIEGEQQAGLTGIFPIRILVRSSDAQNAAEIISKHHLDN